MAKKPFPVWFEYGYDKPERHDFRTVEQRDAFADGLITAAEAFGIDDYMVFFDEKQVDEFMNPGRSDS